MVIVSVQGIYYSSISTVMVHRQSYILPRSRARTCPQLDLFVDPATYQQ